MECGLPIWSLITNLQIATETGSKGSLTCGVLVDLNRPIVHLCNGLHLNVVAITLIQPLPVDVVLKILVRNILGEIVSIFHLIERIFEYEYEGVEIFPTM